MTKSAHKTEDFLQKHAIADLAGSREALDILLAVAAAEAADRLTIVTAGSLGMVSTHVLCRYASAWATARPQLPSVSYESSHPMTPPNLGKSWRRGWITSVTSWDAVK
jgi:hypothetical protein